MNSASFNDQLYPAWVSTEIENYAGDIKHPTFCMLIDIGEEFVGLKVSYSDISINKRLKFAINI
jgi:hypothetical protein